MSQSAEEDKDGEQSAVRNQIALNIWSERDKGGKRGNGAAPGTQG